MYGQERTDDEPEEVGPSEDMVVTEKAVNGEYAQQELYESNDHAGGLNNTNCIAVIQATLLQQEASCSRRVTFRLQQQTRFGCFSGVFVFAIPGMLITRQSSSTLGLRERGERKPAVTENPEEQPQVAHAAATDRL